MSTPTWGLHVISTPPNVVVETRHYTTEPDHKMRTAAANPLRICAPSPPQNPVHTQNRDNAT